MTDNPVARIIEKAFRDGALRHRLLSDMPGTLRKLGERLSPEQAGELKRALDESGESFVSGLDQRLSQSGVSLNPQALLQQSRRKTGRSRSALETLSPESLCLTAVAQKSKKNPAPQQEKRAACGAGGNHLAEDSDEPDYEVETD